MTFDTEIKGIFAPDGVLRASINVGNPILAREDTSADGASGVSVDLARALAGRLGVPLELVVVKSAGRSVQVIEENNADIGFFAIDPVRGANIAFTAPYILIEGAYLVPESSPLRDNSQVDAPEHRVVVGKDSAYDLYLSRELQHAQIVRAPTSPAVFDVFVDQGLEVAAGVRQQLEASARGREGYRLLPGRFMVIRQAMGVHKARGEGAARYLAQFVEDMKAAGFIEQALLRHGIEGASVAPVRE